MRIFFDMDGVLAKWQENESIETVTTEGYFFNLPAVFNVVEAVRMIMRSNTDTEVFILSSVFQDDHSIDEKNAWLDNHNLREIDDAHRLFVPYGTSKSAFLGQKIGWKKSDVLIDDFSKNLFDWHGIAIKMYNHCNGTKMEWTGFGVRNTMDAACIANSILSIATYMEAAEEKKYANVPSLKAVLE